MPGLLWTGFFSSGQVGLKRTVTWVRSYQDSSDQVSSGQSSFVGLLRSGYFRICQFRLGQFRLVRSGQVKLVQVRSGQSGHISSGQVGQVSSG